jgi:CBS domain-containing protein
MTVARILNEKGHDVVTAAPEVSLTEAVATLAEKRIGAVVVVEGAAIRGILSERDVVRAVARHGIEALRLPVGQCMTRDVQTCEPSDSINTVMQTMTSGRFRHLPVLADGKLAGIVSIGDVVKLRLEEVEREADQIREYIATA